jgi:uncharacterized protein (TIGR03437 family)
MNPIVKWLSLICVVAAPVFSQTAPLTITTTSLPNGTVQSPYNQPVQSSGGVGTARTWSIASGALPPGLNLSGTTSTATISGTPTPTSAGSYSFDVVVSDPQNQTARKTLFLYIQPLPLVITSASPLPDGITTVNYSYVLNQSGGASPYSWYLASGSLPNGLNLSSGGAITGVPTSVGVFNFTVGVSDRFETTTTKPFTLTVRTPSLTITTPTPPQNGIIGTPYSLIFAATGGSSPYTFTLANGNLPDGLTLASSGALTGTPTTANTYNFIIRVTDSPPQIAPNQATKQFTLRITAPLTVTTPSPINVTVGSSFAIVNTASGGQTPYQWFVAQGSQLPSWLTLATDGSGFLSGTPPAPGTTNFTIQVTDAAQSSAVKALSIVAQTAAPLVISTTSPLPAGTVGVNYPPLTFTATGGTPPFTWTRDSGEIPLGMSLDPATGVLSGTPQISGSYPLTIRVTDNAKATVTKLFTLPINPGTLTGPSLSTTNLDFFALAGGDAPTPQNVSLISTGAALQFTVQIDGGTAGSPAPSWLVVKLLKGSTPARIPVAVNQTGLSPGKYVARILINTSDGRQSIVTVNLAVDAADPKLDVSPPFLRYTGSPNGVLTFEQNLVLRNVGGGGSIAFQASPVEGSAWLTLRDDIGQTGPNAPAVMRVLANTRGLPRGPRRGLIRVTSSTGSVEVPVTLLVQDDGPVLGLNVSGLRFEARAGNGNSNTRDAMVLNLGQGVVNWKAELVSGSEWLTLGETAGSATLTVPSRLPLSANPGSLSSGSYYGLVKITDSDATSSPQFLTVVLNVLDEATPARPDPSPSGLFFTARSRGPAPAAQPIRVFTSSTTAIPFQASANASDGGWMSIAPASGTTSTQGVAQVSVTVNPTNLPPGTYSGDVTFAFSNTLIRTTNITLVVLPAAGSAASNSRSAVGCAPAKLSLTQTGLVNSFAAPAGWPTPLIVRLADDCGDPVLNGQVVATFSNGDPALTMRLTVPDNGLYSATWAPGGVAGAVTVTARANAPNLAATTADITGTVTPNKVPVLFPNRVVNNLNSLNGAPLSPGMVAQVHGSALAPSTAEPGVLPLRKTFNGTRVLVGAFEAPLYFLSDAQLNVQIPTELAPDREYSIVVEGNGGLTLPDSLTLAQAQPGVAAFADRRIIAQHLNFALITPTAPAQQGEAITLYLVGMGATDVLVASATPSPSVEPLARVKAQPTVTVGGRPASVIFAGLTPGAVGLYQINLFVPTGGTGDLPVVISQNGVEANTTVLPVR